MMPNSPSDTIMAAMLPLRNDGIRNSPKAIMVDSPDALAVQPPGDEPDERRGTEIAKANGIGEMFHGQVQSPMVGACR